MFLSELLVKKMQKYNVIKEDKLLYIYGLNNGFLITINILTALVISILLNSIDIFVPLIITFIALRSFTGGLHFSSKVICYLLSNLVVAVVYLVEPLLFQHILPTLLFSLLCSIYIFYHKPYSTVQKFEPVEIAWFNKKKNIRLITLNIIIIVLIIIDKPKYYLAIMSSIILTAILIIFSKIKEHFTK